MTAATYISTGLVKVKDLMNSWFDDALLTKDISISGLEAVVALAGIEVDAPSATKIVINIYSEPSLTEAADMPFSNANDAVSRGRPFDLKVASAVSAVGTLKYSIPRNLASTNQSPSNKAISLDSPFVFNKDKNYLIRISTTGTVGNISGNLLFVV